MEQHCFVFGSDLFGIYWRLMSLLIISVVKLKNHHLLPIILPHFSESLNSLTHLSSPTFHFLLLPLFFPFAIFFSDWLFLFTCPPSLASYSQPLLPLAILAHSYHPNTGDHTPHCRIFYRQW